MTDEIVDYVYRDAIRLGDRNICGVRKAIEEREFPRRRAFELGCGNGAASHMLWTSGFDVTAVDASESGIEIARASFPQCSFVCASAYDDLAARFGRFDLVLSLEVVQHCTNPRKVARALFDLVEPGGVGIVSATYHGYTKNLVLALSGRLDGHLNALWDSGPVKFFSVRTLRTLLEEVGFRRIEFRLAGRTPLLAKSMVAIAYKDAEEFRP